MSQISKCFIDCSIKRERLCCQWTDSSTSRKTPSFRFLIHIHWRFSPVLLQRTLSKSSENTCGCNNAICSNLRCKLRLAQQCNWSMRWQSGGVSRAIINCFLLRERLIIRIMMTLRIMMMMIIWVLLDEQLWTASYFGSMFLTWEGRWKLCYESSTLIL